MQKNPSPTQSYQFYVPGHRIISIVYRVPSSSRQNEVHTIEQDVADGRLRCDCPARTPCWAQKAVIAGLVKPRVHGMPKAAAPHHPRRPDAAVTVDELFGDAGEGIRRSLAAQKVQHAALTAVAS